MAIDVLSLLRPFDLPIGRVVLHENPTNDAWCRDHGPCFIQRAVDGRREEAIVDWGYNAWGGKYPPFDLDDVIPTRIGAAYDIPVFHPGIVMEGGSLDVNGAGTLLTTEACLLHPNRNPDLGRDEIEGYLREYLGVTHVLWLGDGIVGDDTDGHIDDITRFTDERTVVTVIEEDPRDENYEPLQDNLRRLQGMTDQDGRPLRIVTLPMPRALYQDDQRLPASYANFYIANGVVLLPAYDPATGRDGPRHPAGTVSHPARGPHRRHRPRLGTWSFPLRLAAVARLGLTPQGRPAVRPYSSRSTSPFSTYHTVAAASRAAALSRSYTGFISTTSQDCTPRLRPAR